MWWHFKFCIKELSLISWRFRNTRNTLLNESRDPSSPAVCVRTLSVSNTSCEFFILGVDDFSQDAHSYVYLHWSDHCMVSCPLFTAELSREKLCCFNGVSVPFLKFSMSVSMVSWEKHWENIFTWKDETCFIPLFICTFFCGSVKAARPIYATDRHRQHSMVH